MKGSLRKRVFEAQNEGKSNKEIYAQFPDANKVSVKRYIMQWRKIKKELDKKPINIKEELIKIIRDNRAPASSRVQAIREFNAMRKEQPEIIGEVVDPFMKILEEKRIEEKEAFNEWKKGEGFSENDNNPKIRLIYEAYLEKERKQYKEWKIKNGIPLNSGTAMDRLRYENEKQEESLKLYDKDKEL